jgi:hypothetical protein
VGVCFLHIQRHLLHPGLLLTSPPIPAVQPRPLVSTTAEGKAATLFKRIQGCTCERKQVGIGDIALELKELDLSGAVVIDFRECSLHLRVRHLAPQLAQQDTHLLHIDGSGAVRVNLVEQLLGRPVIRVRVEIMGPVKCENAGESQSVPIMINPIIFTRTRTSPGVAAAQTPRTSPHKDTPGCRADKPRGWTHLPFSRFFSASSAARRSASSSLARTRAASSAASSSSSCASSASSSRRFAYSHTTRSR